MRHTLCFLCCAFLLTVNSVVASARQVRASESTVTVTATIEAIDKANRTITLKRPKGGSIEIAAPEQMEGFNSLRVGDEVSATYFEALVINLRKPGDPDRSGASTTTTRKDRKPGSETRRQRTVTGTVQSIDQKASALTVKTAQGSVVALAVEDAKQLQGLSVGDSVDLTYYESLLIKVARPSK